MKHVSPPVGTPDRLLAAASRARTIGDVLETVAKGGNSADFKGIARRLD